MEFRRCEDQALVMKDGDLLGKWWVETWLEGNFFGVSWMYDIPPNPRCQWEMPRYSPHQSMVNCFIYLGRCLKKNWDLYPLTGDVSGK